MSPHPRHPCHPPGDIAVSPEPSVNPHPTPKEGALARGVGAGPLPGNFDISEDVQTWAKSHGIDRLRDHLEAFKLKALAKGYLNVDWDAAFKRAVMEDWAKLRKDAVPSTAATKICGRCAEPLNGGSTRMRLVGDVCNSCWSAYRDNEWSPEIDARPVAKHAGKHEPTRAVA